MCSIPFPLLPTKDEIPSQVVLISLQDLFRLVFYGNAPLAGSTLQLNGLVANRLRYNQLQLGFNKLMGNNDVQYMFGGGISFLQGLSHLAVVIDDGSIFTHEDGEYIDISIRMQAEHSDTGNLKSTAFNGIGFSTDLSFNYNKIGNFSINVYMADLGYITWAKNAQQLSMDTAFRYEGIVIPDILNFDEGVLSQNLQDSLTEDLTPDSQSKKYSTTLPMRFYLSFTKYLANSRVILTGGINHRLSSNYRLLLFLKGGYAIKPDFLASIYSSIGGYGKYNFGIEVNKSFNDRFQFILGSQSLQGLIMPASTTSLSVYLRLGITI